MFRSWSRDEDSRNAFLLISGISIVVIFALGIALYGYLKARDTDSDVVLRVGDREISYSYLQARMTPFLQIPGAASPTQFSNVLSGLITEVEQEPLLHHIAKRDGISVTDEEVEAEMRNDLNVADDASRELLASALRRELLQTGLSLGQYEYMLEARVIEGKLRDEATSTIPAETEQVDIRLLQVPTREEADAAKARIDGGEVMGLVAAAVSKHPSSARGGEIGWVARGSFDSKLEDVMFSQPVDTISGIVETDDGFYIVNVRQKEVRAVDDSVRGPIVSRAFTQKLEGARDEVGSEMLLTTNHVNRLANHFASSINTGG